MSENRQISNAPSHAHTYREVAKRLRRQAAANSPEIRSDMEATARQYDRLAESAEELSKPEAGAIKRQADFWTR
jgi:hypothetical protein